MSDRSICQLHFINLWTDCIPNTVQNTNKFLRNIPNVIHAPINKIMINCTSEGRISEWSSLYLQITWKQHTQTSIGKMYGVISSISHPKSQNLKVSRLVLQLYLLILLKPGAKSRMKT